MNRQPLTPRTEPVGTDGLTFRERAWLQQARKHVAELNALLAERGNPGRYTVDVAGLAALPPEKLIRDRIPDIAAARGQAPMAVRQATTAEMPGLLLAKLGEELAEVRAADAGGVLGELADLLEVVFALAALHGCDRGDLREIARAKAEARGGFRDRLVWTAAPAAAGEGR